MANADFLTVVRLCYYHFMMLKHLLLLLLCLSASSATLSVPLTFRPTSNKKSRRQSFMINNSSVFNRNTNYFLISRLHIFSYCQWMTKTKILKLSSLNLIRQCMIYHFINLFYPYFLFFEIGLPNVNTDTLTCLF